MAEKLIFLLNNPTRARETGEAGKIHVRKNFRIDQAVCLVADVYRATYAKFKQQQKAAAGKK